VVLVNDALLCAREDGRGFETPRRALDGAGDRRVAAVLD
jgi:hypothetical protein